MQKYSDIEANHRTNFMVLYFSSNKAISHLEQIILNDCKNLDIPRNKIKIYLKNIKKKNIQMVAKFKSMDSKY